MTGTPIDLAGLVAPEPRRRSSSLPALILPGVGKADVDPYEVEVSALKVFPAQVGFTTGRVGVRKGGLRTSLGLTPAQLRTLGDHLHDVADLLDPPLPEDR